MGPGVSCLGDRGGVRGDWPAATRGVGEAPGSHGNLFDFLNEYFLGWERINCFYIDFNGKYCFALRVIRLESRLLERIKLVNQGTTVLAYYGMSSKK